MRPSIFVPIAACLLSIACSSEHGHEHGPEGHGHPHAEAAERPTLSVTAYESGLELFMEYPALVVGQPSPLVAHFTDARDPERFTVVTKGQVTATLRYADGSEERFVAKELLRDGIFKPVVQPTRAGAATLVLELTGPQVAGTVSAGKVQVHPSVAVAAAAAPTEEGGEEPVGYLKEQQWKTTYATAVAERRPLRDGVRANGELKPVGGQAAELSAPIAGRVALAADFPHLGRKVRKGELLLSVVPVDAAGGQDRAALEAAASQARAELGYAERDVARAEELLAALAIPEKQLDAARVAREVAQAKLRSAERQLAHYRGSQSGGTRTTGGAAFELRAPLDGVIAFSDVTPGAIVGAGQRLVSVVNGERLWLETRVFESDAPRIQESPGVAFTIAGLDRTFTVDEKNGRRVAVGAVVDAATRTVPVIFELPNVDGLLKPGMFVKATLLTGESVEGVAIPEQAIVDDGGRPTVFVMDGGESFFKRRVKPGIRSDGWVQILDGVEEGDRVASRGAYEIKLSAASGAIPEHGHQH